MKSLIIKLTFLLSILLLPAVKLRAQDVMLTVIANAKGAPADLSLTQLRSVLKGERLRWADGTKVVIALMKTNTAAGLSTCKRLYKMTPNDVNKLFLALVFQGKGEEPKFFNTVAELESFIDETPGAIGVIEVNENDKEKVIYIDGKKSI